MNVNKQEALEILSKRERKVTPRAHVVEVYGVEWGVNEAASILLGKDIADCNTLASRKFLMKLGLLPYRRDSW